MPRDCEQRCPELDACINASLWCDGISHCPSGYDEALTHCSVLLQLPPLHLGLGLLAIITILAVIIFVIWRICRQRTNRSISQHRLKSISSETAIIDGKEVICWHSDSSVRYVEVDRVTTVWRSPTVVPFVARRGVVASHFASSWRRNTHRLHDDVHLHVTCRTALIYFIGDLDSKVVRCSMIWTILALLYLSTERDLLDIHKFTLGSLLDSEKWWRLSENNEWENLEINACRYFVNVDQCAVCESNICLQIFF